MGTKLADVGASASETMSGIKKQAEEGSLLQNTQEAALSAAQKFAGFGSSWMSKAKGYMNGEESKKKAPPAEERKEGDPDSPRVETDVKIDEPKDATEK